MAHPEGWDWFDGVKRTHQSSSNCAPQRPGSSKKVPCRHSGHAASLQQLRHYSLVLHWIEAARAWDNLTECASKRDIDQCQLQHGRYPCRKLKTVKRLSLRPPPFRTELQALHNPLVPLRRNAHMSKCQSQANLDVHSPQTPEVSVQGL